MRLIDADALNKELQKRVGSPTEDKLYEVNLCIINAPTIDAIPVEWLEEQRDKLGEAWAEEWHEINGLIEQWREEREATKG